MAVIDAPIAVQDVKLSTATVEIKTLTLGKKQMTLSVFRQLPASQIIIPDIDATERFREQYSGKEFDEYSSVFKLDGVPWGLVNYFWKDCCFVGRGIDFTPSHIHVVWEKEGRLYRAGVTALIPEALGYQDAEDRRFWHSRAGSSTKHLWLICHTELSQLPQLFIAV